MKDKEKRNVTFQDIAKKLGISSSTVSRSLNNNSKISDETKQKVYKAAQELGYQPNIPGFFEKHSKQKSVCIIVPDLQDSLYINTIDKIQKNLNGYNCMVSSSMNNINREKDLVENYLDLGIEGFFISLCDYNCVDHIKELLKKEIPVVLFNNVNFDLFTQKIAIDNFQGAYKAVEHLASLNCKEIALVNANDTTLVCKDLYNGYVAALKSLNFSVKLENIFTLNATKTNFRSIADALLNMEVLPDAIIFSDSDLAMQFIAFSKQSNVKIPQDVKIVCYGNEKYNEYLNPSITSIECSADKIGDLAIKCFLNQVKLDERIGNSLVVPTKMIIRSSSISM